MIQAIKAVVFVGTIIVGALQLIEKVANGPEGIQDKNQESQKGEFKMNNALKQIVFYGSLAIGVLNYVTRALDNAKALPKPAEVVPQDGPENQ